MASRELRLAPPGATPDIIIHPTTILDTPVGPLILPVGTFLSPLPLPKLSGPIPIAQDNLQTGAFSKPKERTQETEAAWIRIRDRDTIIGEDGVRVHRVKVGRRGLPAQPLVYLADVREKGDFLENCRFQLMDYDTKFVWWLVGDENGIRRFARRGDVEPVLPYGIYSDLPVVGPFRRLTLWNRMCSRRQGTFLRAALEKGEAVRRNRRFMWYGEGVNGIAPSPLRRATTVCRREVREVEKVEDSVRQMRLGVDPEENGDGGGDEMAAKIRSEWERILEGTGADVDYDDTKEEKKEKEKRSMFRSLGRLFGGEKGE